MNEEECIVTYACKQHGETFLAFPEYKVRNEHSIPLCDGCRIAKDWGELTLNFDSLANSDELCNLRTPPSLPQSS